MCYRSGYNGISPEHRAAYIKWLAGNRSDPKVDIDYIFLYFCGIERRLLINDKNERASDDERNALVLELKRLKTSTMATISSSVSIACCHTSGFPSTGARTSAKHLAQTR